MNTVEIAQQWLKKSSPETQAMVEILFEVEREKQDLKSEGLYKEFYRKEYHPSKWDGFADFLEPVVIILSLAFITAFITAFIVLVIIS